MTREEILQIAKPILFNTDMVLAILDNRKSETRRVIKFPVNKFTCKIPNTEKINVYNNTIYGEKVGFHEKPHFCFTVKKPHQVGDYLYVRETWSEWTGGYVYKAWTSPFPQPGRYPDKMMKWHPSIHMPKEAARIWLKVKDVRPERLQDMTLDDFLNEGVSIPYEAFNDPDNAYMQAKSLFTDIWNSTVNKKERDLYEWSANPWVWAINFERVEILEEWK